MPLPGPGTGPRVDRAPNLSPSSPSQSTSSAASLLEGGRERRAKKDEASSPNEMSSSTPAPEKRTIVLRSLSPVSVTLPSSVAFTELLWKFKFNFKSSKRREDRAERRRTATEQPLLRGHPAPCAEASVPLASASILTEGEASSCFIENISCMTGKLEQGLSDCTTGAALSSSCRVVGISLPGPNGRSGGACLVLEACDSQRLGLSCREEIAHYKGIHFNPVPGLRVLLRWGKSMHDKGLLASAPSFVHQGLEELCKMAHGKLILVGSKALLNVHGTGSIDTALQLLWWASTLENLGRNCSWEGGRGSPPVFEQLKEKCLFVSAHELRGRVPSDQVSMPCPTREEDAAVQAVEFLWHVCCGWHGQSTSEHDFLASAAGLCSSVPGQELSTIVDPPEFYSSDRCVMWVWQMLDWSSRVRLLIKQKQSLGKVTCEIVKGFRAEDEVGNKGLSWNSWMGDAMAWLKDRHLECGSAGELEFRAVLCAARSVCNLVSQLVCELKSIKYFKHALYLCELLVSPVHDESNGLWLATASVRGMAHKDRIMILHDGRVPHPPNEGAKKAALAALEDPAVTCGFRFWVEKWARNHSGSWDTPPQAFIPAWTAETINEMYFTTGKSDGRILYAVDGEEMMVEPLALRHYSKGGWKGVMSEWRLPRALLVLVCWRHLWRGGALPHAYCNLPVDFCQWEQSWEPHLGSRLHEVASMTSEQLEASIRQNFATLDAFSRLHGSLCIAMFELNDLVEIARAMGGSRLASLLNHFVLDPYWNQFGVPDLLLWREGEKASEWELKFVEVKSKNDELSDHQHSWLQVLSEFGFQVSVCRVLDAGPRIKRRYGGVRPVPFKRKYSSRPV